MGWWVWVGRVTGAGWYRNLMANTRRGFESMNHALKGRVEKRQVVTGGLEGQQLMPTVISAWWIGH